jgi:hypothetical protein
MAADLLSPTKAENYFENVIKIQKKEREGWEGEESEGQRSEALLVLRFIGKYFINFNPFSTYT